MRGVMRLSTGPGAGNTFVSAVTFGLISIVAACSTVAPSYRDTEVPITSMATFDAARYAGVWYEIARYPTIFQSGCGQSTATYAETDTGQLLVENACPRSGEIETIRGSAEVVGPGRLNVRLNGVPVAAPYWVLWVDETYSTAVVGVPSGRAGWILNREPQISKDRWDAALRVLDFNGYDVSALIVNGEIEQ